MTWNWFDLAWPWIGAAGAVVLLVLLFGTNLLRSEQNISRWRDRSWLSWLTVFAYMTHNIEEYGIDLFGRTHAFPGSMCTTLKLPVYPDCPIPPLFYLTVNILLIWVAGPLAAMLSRRHPLIGLSMWGLLLTNAFPHIGSFLAGHGFNPGTLTSLVLFLPLAAWIAYACFLSGNLSLKAIPVLIATGVILHAVLLGSVLLFINGAVSSTVLVGNQVLNAVLFLLIPWLGEKLLGEALIRPAATTTTVAS